MIASQSTKVRRLVARCLEHLENGDTGEVDEVLRRNPRLAGAVRSRLERLREAGILEEPEPWDRAFPERVGPFRLLKRLGGGGMGVVYLALEEPLGRNVALKLVRPDLVYFDRARERFRREVEAASRLNHPAIVPVFSVGEADGVPYYAMQHVEGKSLDEILRSLRDRRPERLSGRDLLASAGAAAGTAEAPGESARFLSEATWVDAAFHLVLQLAEAIDHAHRQGVLHRDIKPSNVMLGPDGRVMLLDFGLASTRRSGKLTHTGTQIGSLAYMAPEQLKGSQIDERTDVYALGVTLCELLTLRSPFLDADPDITRSRILDGVPPPIRTWNRTVPWDAETVCLTAMEKDPARRCRTAAVLARDLLAVLERRPIAARRAGAFLRMRRLAQRHPAWSVGVALGAVLVFGSLGFAIRERNVNRALSIALDERDVALGEARNEFQRALRATNEMLRSVAQFRLRDVPGADPLRRELIGAAAALYEELLAEHPEDSELLREAAVGFRYRGQLLNLLGDHDAALASVDRSLDLLGRARTARPADDLALEEIVHSLNERGIVLSSLGRQKEQAECMLRAVGLARELCSLRNAEEKADHETWETRMVLSGQLASLGSTFAQARNYADARETLTAARRLLAELLAERPESSDCRFRLATCCSNLGGMLFEASDLEGAAEALGQSVSHFGRLVADKPEEAANRWGSAHARFNHGLCLAVLGKTAESDRATAECVDLLRGLARDFPENVQYRETLVRALTVRGTSLSQFNDPERHGLLLEEACAEADLLFGREPATPSAWEVGVFAWQRRGSRLLESGNSSEAAAVLRRALARSEEISVRWPDHVRGAVDQETIESLLALALFHEGRLDEALALAQRAAETPAAPGRAHAAKGLPGRLVLLAQIAVARGDHVQAASACRDVLLLGTTPADERIAAGFLSRCVGLAGDDHALAAGYAADAVLLLESALSGGLENPNAVLAAADFEVLRVRPDFQALADRFARGE